MKIAIGSKNPIKIKAARQAFLSIWPDEKLELVASDVPSGVSDQPLTMEDTIKGAINRAKTVKVALRPDYAVGIESGLVKIGTQWFEDGWVAIIDAYGRIGLGGAPRIEVAPPIMKLIRQGHEMADAADSVFGSPGATSVHGYSGLLTDSLFTTTDVLCDAAIMALGRFVHPEIFDV